MGITKDAPTASPGAMVELLSLPTSFTAFLSWIIVVNHPKVSANVMYEVIAILDSIPMIISNNNLFIKD